jgi:hypothetical protein
MLYIVAIMSYDLNFYKRKESTLTEEGVTQYLNEHLPYNVSEYYKQWVYENPETGVYFVVEQNEADTDAEDIELFNNVPAFENSNFSCSINFFRPTYFGFEIFPIIEKFMSDLDLYVLNPQDDVDFDNPQKFLPGYLQNQWISQNRELVKENFEKMQFKYMPLEKSNSLWEFQFQRELIQNNLSEDIFVAGILVLQSNEGEQLYTVCVWPEHIPVVLPQVDYVIIKKKYSRFFKNIEESGLVSYSHIMSKLGHAFEDFKHEVPGLKVLRQRQADKLSKGFNSLPILKEAVEFGRKVGLDNFVNYLP